jgi:HD superfamily phosphohydrolase
LHKATRGAELLFVELISRVVTLCQNGESKLTGLPNLHPLVKFAKKPTELERALELDDAVIWGALPMLKEAKDKVIAETEHLQARKLFKCVDVQVELGKSINPKGSDDTAKLKSIDVASARAILAIDEWNSRHSSDTKRILIDQYSRTPYKSVEDTDGPLDQIHIKTASGELVDLKKRSKVVDALTPFKIVRAYVADNDDDARNALKKIIEEACDEKQAS